jgi:subtilisin family serine protease
MLRHSYDKGGYDMTATVGGPSEQKYFSLRQMENLAGIVEGKPADKSQAAPAGDTFKSRKSKHTGDKLDVILVPGPKLTKKTSRSDHKVGIPRDGVEIEKELGTINGVVARVDQATASRLREDGFLVYDNSPRVLVPGVPLPSGERKPWDMPAIDPVAMTHADDVHQEGQTAKGQVIAIIDSGYDHPQVPLKAWYDAVDGTTQQFDPVGHGTHCAGDTLKMAPDAGLVAVRVMNENGEGRPSDIISGIEWTIANKDRLGIGVINLSLGGGPDGIPYNYDPICQAVEKAVRAGIDVVAAAGNAGPEKATLGSPAEDPAIITVGSALDQNTVSDFSSRGPTDSGDHKPDIMAPGEFITSWNVEGSTLDRTAKAIEKLRKMPAFKLTYLLKNNPEIIKGLGLPEDILSRTPEEIEMAVKTALPPMYQPDPESLAAPGTSFAAPQVTGIVAALRQAGRSLSPLERKEILIKTAENMGNFDVDTQGAGFVNAHKAFERISVAVRKAMA